MVNIHGGNLQGKGTDLTTETLDSVRLKEALKRVIDPEIYQNIVDLGLVYGVDVEPDDNVVVTMTLTTPRCPMGPEIIADVEKTIREEGAEAVDVNIVWEPRWTPDMMTDDLKKELGMEEEEPVLTIDRPQAPPPRRKQPKKKGLLSWLFGR